MSLEGRKALVTGGTRGIGLAITRALRREGAEVLAIGKAKDQIESVRQEFKEDPLVTVEQADVRDRAALESLRDRLDGLDILVPNAGVNTRVKALDLPDEPLREMLDTNLYGVFVTCQVFGPLLFARPGGRVVVTGSLASIHGMDLRVAYAATKAGISGLVRSLAIEWGPKGVTVNAVGPGIIKTPLTKAYMEQFPDKVKASIANTPLGRLGEPEDVADVVAFLASEKARFITGQTIYVDGGISAGSSWW
ncbi:MAG TPA: SDR family NAD(P)-dependent oxidoreductase [Candidatus Dormibacteraeota bacterium]|nr:SDR family NAD(P)-dependent oxidoreductase [Candidatus Dormibacteraeota bacterium]